jgi:hypothetical protein
VLYCHAVQLRRTLTALQKLNDFSKTELLNERLHDVVSTDSVVAGAFTLLSNLLCVPSATCCSFANMETIVSTTPLGLFLCNCRWWSG